MKALNWLRHPLGIAFASLGLLGLISLLPRTEETGGSLSLIRLVLALVAILALAQAALPLLRRMPAGRRGKSRRLHCEEILALDSRHRLALVSVDGRELLLSLQSDGTTLLSGLAADAAAPAQAALDPDESADFARQLARRRAARA